MGLLTFLETAHMLHGNCCLNSSRSIKYKALVFFILTAVNCGTLTNPTNGSVTHTAGTTFGRTATYSCNVGYNLVGGRNRTCQATAVWSGNAPTCQGICMFLHLVYLYTAGTGIWYLCVLCVN